VRAVPATAPDYVASHGLTLFHDGAARDDVGRSAIRSRFAKRRGHRAYDFRRADCAAGGQGAPLVPYVDALLFGEARTSDGRAQPRRHREPHA
jgi:anhydro-N-acetylmuramic acid kinase